MPNEQQIRQIIREEIQAQDIRSRFGLQSIPYHTHDGTDAPFAWAPYQSYIGFVPSDGDINSILGSFLPQGWNLSTSGTGVYTIVHNLGTNLYAFVADASQSTNEKVAPVVAPDAVGNQLTISWFRCTDGTGQNTSFTFILTSIGNINSIPPAYTTNRFS